MKIQIIDREGLKELDVERVNVIVSNQPVWVGGEETTATMYLKLSDEGLIVDLEDAFGANIGTEAYDNDWFLGAVTVEDDD